jgi:HK97 family phage major capsid protein
VPESFSETVFKKMAWFDPLFDAMVVNLVISDSGSPFKVPALDSTASATVYAENQVQTPSDIPAFSQVTLAEATTYRTPLQQVSMELGADSNYPLQDVLSSCFAPMLARAAGAGLYSTLASSASSGVVLATGHATDVTVDGLFDLAASVDPAYQGSRCSWLMRYGTALVVSKLKDSAGMPIFNINPDANGDRWLLGRRVLICPSAAALGANNKPILFGDLGQFAVRMVRQVSIKRFAELYATQGMIAYQSFARCNGALAVADSVKFLQNSAT